MRTRAGVSRCTPSALAIARWRVAGIVSDGERLARVEERIEALVKRTDVLEDTLRDRLDDLKAEITGGKTELKATINGRIKEVEQRNILVRGIVYGACGIVLAAFFGAVVAAFIGVGIRPVPTLPQPYTIQPRTR